MRRKQSRINFHVGESVRCCADCCRANCNIDVSLGCYVLWSVVTAVAMNYSQSVLRNVVTAVNH
jgi:hypothetical protein